LGSARTGSNPVRSEHPFLFFFSTKYKPGIHVVLFILIYMKLRICYNIS
jgi:hypothetical protein